jgi:hypothetical protein
MPATLQGGLSVPLLSTTAVTTPPTTTAPTIVQNHQRV